MLMWWWYTLLSNIVHPTILTLQVGTGANYALYVIRDTEEEDEEELEEYDVLDQASIEYTE